MMKGLCADWVMVMSDACLHSFSVNAEAAETQRAQKKQLI